MFKSVIALGLMAWTAAAEGSDCAHRAAREATVDAAGARLVKVDAGAGSLKVEGRPGSSVVVHGTACASRAGVIDQVQVRVRRDGDTVRIETLMPESNWSIGGTAAWLDLVVEVPSSLDVDVHDGSGSLEIAGVGAARVEDGSGEIHIRDVERDVEVRDGSGEIEIRGVGGSVEIPEDGSGSIEVDGVRGDVRVDDDGSGSISVHDVGGDFTVRHDGSGGIEQHDVRGRVSIPHHR
jgi:hypothetical protein